MPKTQELPAARQPASPMFEEIQGFLGKVPPFQFLAPADLLKVVMDVSVEFFPKGKQILLQNGPPANRLMVISKGGVKVSVGAGDEEAVLDFRAVGDVVGLLSLVSADKSRTNVVAIEDTTVYQIERAKILPLLEANGAFMEYYLKSYLPKFIDAAFAHMSFRSPLAGGGDKLLFTTPVGELGANGAATQRETVSIREAAGIMSARNISSLIIVDDRGVPIGIVTDRDLRDKVAAVGRDSAEVVGAIMTRSLLTIDAQRLAFEALLTMIRHNVHHLIVLEAGRLKGVITNHDLMLLQGTSPVSLTRDFEDQQTVDGVVPAARKINSLVTLLLKDGAKASNITRMVTEINDRLVLKLLEIAERTLGRPPVAYCWITFGSEGRKEQTFKTDQDNALIYADSPSPGEQAAAGAYFARFADFVNDALVQCGFPECPGNYMARNPAWCQPLSVWRNYFTRWISTPTEEAILRSVILFDFRPVGGDHALAGELKSHLLRSLSGQDLFLKKMADLAVSVRPPIGFFKGFIVLKSGEHKDQIDFKKKCITPLINAVRLFSLQEGLAETSTLERIHALRNGGTVVAEFADELVQAFEFFLLLRIHHQYGQIQAGQEPDNFINPNELTNLQKKLFRDSCQTIATVLDAANRRYNPGQGF